MSRALLEAIQAELPDVVIPVTRTPSGRLEESTSIPANGDAPALAEVE